MTATPAPPETSEPAAAVSPSGIGFALAGYLIWGLFPLYWPLLEPAGASEMVAHRMAWSLPAIGVLLVIVKPWRSLHDLLRRPRLVMLLAVSAAVMALNWALFIYGVVSGNVLQTALGYFINPLVTVVLAAIVLKERLRPVQWTAVGLAAIGMIVLSVDYGRPPWIAIGLAVTFAAYGLAKKKADAPAIEGMAVESAVLFLPACLLLAWIAASGDLVFGQQGAAHSLLLAGAGVVTVAPLLLFGAAATRIPLSTLGLLQYLVPSLHFLLGVAVFDEPVPPLRLLGFAFVWTALALFSWAVFPSRSRASYFDLK
jgi:chloramphenicol-sensitive protein RarD